MDALAVHLARKWRSRSFSTIKGQDLVVRILQNNLYRGYFFPLYLFAGPRGSGKTSTARIFAAAINCKERASFQAAPREVAIPCHACQSCQSLFTGSHPDIIEVDAASYTGVDNVRSIIDSATLLPVMGEKKIYIIDEAHMLSKAACNAFLKILEEPPSSALFILATTDPSKIITTITSRSLQLYFDRVTESVLREHMQHVAEYEQIDYEEAGITRLVQAADGSVRDALQLLERVHLASDAITRNAVVQTLGEIDEQTVIDLFIQLAQHDMATSMQYIHDAYIQQYAPMRVWHRIVSGLRALFWGHFGVSDPLWEQTHGFYNLVHTYSQETLQQLLQVVYTYEPYLVKTTQTQPLFEMLFFELKRIIDGSGQSVTTAYYNTSESTPLDSTSQQEVSTPSVSDASAAPQNQQQSGGAWQTVMYYFEQNGDPLLTSVFKQAQDVTWQDDSTLCITFARELQFYYDWMKDHTSVLQHAVEQVYGVTPDITFTFNAASLEGRSGTSKERQQKKTDDDASSSAYDTSSGDNTQKRHAKSRSNQRSRSSRYEAISDIQDTDKWPFASVVLQAFPGSIKRMKRE